MINLPEYSYGICKSCGEIDELGDGLCMKCWDGPEDMHERRKIILQRNRVIVKMLKSGRSAYELGRIFKLDPSTIKDIGQKGMAYA